MKRAPILLLCGLAAYAQAQAPPTFRSGTREILVDAVVRDRGGKLVHGLSASDFELLEDGTPQQILSVREDVTTTTFESVERGKAPQPAAVPQSANSAADLLQRLQLVAVVFDRVGPESWRLARHAALDALKAETGPNTHFGVFVIQNSLLVVQTYTSDRTLLRKAVERATGGPKLDVVSDSTGMRSVIIGTMGPTASASGNTGLVSPAAAQPLGLPQTADRLLPARWRASRPTWRSWPTTRHVSRKVEHRYTRCSP
jgi:VWFA-related protein